MATSNQKSRQSKPPTINQLRNIGRKQHREITDTELASFLSLTNSWAGIADQLAPSLSVLVQNSQLRGIVSLDQLGENQEFLNISNRIQGAVNQFSTVAETTVRYGQERMAALGLSHAQQLLLRQYIAAPTLSVATLLTNKLGIAQDGQPIVEKLKSKWLPSTMTAAKTLIEGLHRKEPERNITPRMLEALGQNLQQAFNVYRGETMAKYRAAQAQQYAVASGPVLKYMRQALYSRRSCAACIISDGKIYDKPDEMDKHLNCRCILVPVTDEQIVMQTAQASTGHDWLLSQEPAVQQQILGKGVYQLFKAGRIQLTDLIRVSDDSTYGPQLSTRPLYDLAS
jgi:hypothetical protein